MSEIIEQVVCCECDKTYHRPEDSADIIRWAEVCEECKPTPKQADITYGEYYIPYYDK